MVEQVPYRVIARHNGWEHRRYDDYVLVTVDVSGDAEEASYRAFSPLFQFISGANEGNTKIAMTAPVLQESPTPTSHRVSFAMPQAMADRVPAPSDGRLHIEKIPAHEAAAVSFRGSWRPDQVSQKTELLRQEMAKAGLTATGPASFARYDAPSMPAIFRRNEVIIPC